MLSIRFTRTGKKKQPYYRIVVLEKSKDPWGDYLELLGNYNPRSKEMEVKDERLKYWVSKGAQMTNSVFNLMLKRGLVEGKPRKSVKLSKSRTAKLNEKKKVEADKIAAAKAATEVKAAPVEEPIVEEVKE